MNVKRLVLILIQLTFYSISDAQISYTLKPISYEHKILVKMNLDTQTEEFVLADLNDVYRLVLNNKTKQNSHFPQIMSLLAQVSDLLQNFSPEITMITEKVKVHLRILI